MFICGVGLLIIFVSFIGKTEASCAQITRYNDCLNKNTLKIMSCEAKNSGPMFEYYNCLCEMNKSLHECYSLCADDQTLQLESQTAQINILSICQQAAQMTPTSTTSTPTTTPTVKPVPVNLPTTQNSTTTTSSTTSSPTPTRKPVTIFSSGNTAKLNHFATITVVFVNIILFKIILV